MIGEMYNSSWSQVRTGRQPARTDNAGKDRRFCSALGRIERHSTSWDYLTFISASAGKVLRIAQEVNLGAALVKAAAAGLRLSQLRANLKGVFPRR